MPVGWADRVTEVEGLAEHGGAFEARLPDPAPFVGRGVVGLAGDRVVGPVGRTVRLHLAREEDGRGEEDAADPMRTREWPTGRCTDVLADAGDDVGEGSGPVGLAEGVPRLADGEPAEGGEGAEPDDGVAVGLLELEGEGVAKRERFEGGAARRLPGVGLV